MTTAGLTLEYLAPHVGEPFTVAHTNTGSFQVTLAQATLLPYSSPGRETPAFQLQFHAPQHSVAAFSPQQIYTLTHERLGSMEMFLVPIGPPRNGEGGFLYQAVFH